jgi:hypothetical protein
MGVVRTDHVVVIASSAAVPLASRDANCVNTERGLSVGMLLMAGVSTKHSQARCVVGPASPSAILPAQRQAPSACIGK